MSSLSALKVRLQFVRPTMISRDTIAAISSTLAPAARIIVRLTGETSHALASEISVFKGDSNASAQPTFLAFNDLKFPAWLYIFHAPRSYTGEDVIEFHLPGSPVLAKLLLDHLYKLGARPAQPGEFTARAFFNGKIGLTEAEGVAATIAAGNQTELLAARQLLAGELARRLTPMIESIAQTLALIEVSIDFTEEDVTFLAGEEVTQRIQDAAESLADLLDQSARFEQLTHEPKIVFIGRPNAGKSSLINTLTDKTRAVVSNQAGTTRDVLTAPLMLNSGQVLLTDVAGLEPGDQDPIGRQMQQRALTAVHTADYVIHIQDCTDVRSPIELPRQANLHLLTKCDLLIQPSDLHPALQHANAILISSKTGAGIDSLRTALDHLAFGSEAMGSVLTLNRRHLSAINSARESLARANARVAENAPELVAMDLRDALDHLGSIVGQITPDDILGRVFSAFCIGK